MSRELLKRALEHLKAKQVPPVFLIADIEAELAMRDDEVHFLQWIYNRLVNVHDENPKVDYMITFKSIIENMS